MNTLPATIRGPLFMAVATGSYLINDTFLKLATTGLPPNQVLFLRGVAALMIGLPLLFVLGQGRRMPVLFERRVLARNLLETVGVLCYVVALANMPIADVVALGQLTPLFMLLGGSMLFRERIGGVRMALIGCGFIGAIMVAQPTLGGISVYAMLALGNAVFCAARDLAGRRIGAEVPGMIVAMSAVIVVGTISGLMHLATETWVMPDLKHLPLLAGAGFFLIFGHFFIFMAYRTGPAQIVAPFYYTFSVWAVISGLLVFGEFPNLLAVCGIALIVGSGLVIVMLDRRRPKPVPAA